MSIHDYFQSFELTSDQQKAMTAIEQFLQNDTPVFRLTGYAGTGKTTLMEGLCRYLDNAGRAYSLMAPTGRAAMVLHQRTRKEASTIHRAIYNMDELLEKKMGTSYKYYFGVDFNHEGVDKVYIVDEASMVSDAYSDDEFFMFGSGHLLSDLFKYVFQDNSSRKILFIGDDAQLPPVGMNFSPALDGEYLKSSFNAVSDGAVLRQVMRQAAGSSILKTATEIRQSLEDNTFNSFRLVPGDDLSRLELDDFMLLYMKAARSSGVANCVVLTHSNRQALEYNEMIREKRYGQRGETIQKQDLLIITRNNYNLEVELFNGTFARVIEAGDIVYEATPRFIVEGGKSVSRHLKFREVSIEVNSLSMEPFVLNCTILDGFLNSEKGSLHPHDQRALYIDFKDRMKKQGLRPNDAEFRKRMKKDVIFNAVQAKYGYAITCHKAQGGEWPHVMVDFDVFIGRYTSGYFRWVYTAVTRAGKQLYGIGAKEYSPLDTYQVKDIQPLGNVLPGMYYYPAEEGQSFVEYRIERLQKICNVQRVEVEIKKLQNQLEVKFGKGQEQALVRLWYKKQGFTRTTREEMPDPAFNMLVETILFESLLVSDFSFHEKFPFQRKMKTFFQSVLQEENLPMTNIVQREWCDAYYFKTEADCALVEFWYNSKHIFTYAQPRSTLGSEDKELNRIVERLRGIH